MTGTLKIRYRRPTPLLAPLELVARNTGHEGRKIFAWGGIYYQGELTAEADGIFIDVPPGRMLDIVSGQRQRGRGAAGRPGVAADDRRSRCGGSAGLSYAATGCPGRRATKQPESTVISSAPPH